MTNQSPTVTKHYTNDITTFIAKATLQGKEVVYIHRITEEELRASLRASEYHVVDASTGKVKGVYQLREAAEHVADYLNMVYGTTRYTVRSLHV